MHTHYQNGPCLKTLGAFANNTYILKQAALLQRLTDNKERVCLLQMFQISQYYKSQFYQINHNFIRLSFKKLKRIF